MSLGLPTTLPCTTVAFCMPARAACPPSPSLAYSLLRRANNRYTQRCLSPACRCFPPLCRSALVSALGHKMLDEAWNFSDPNRYLPGTSFARRLEIWEAFPCLGHSPNVETGQPTSCRHFCWHSRGTCLSLTSPLCGGAAVLHIRKLEAYASPVITSLVAR